MCASEMRTRQHATGESPDMGMSLGAVLLIMEGGSID